MVFIFLTLSNTEFFLCRRILKKIIYVLIYMSDICCRQLLPGPVKDIEGKIQNKTNKSPCCGSYGPMNEDR